MQSTLLNETFRARVLRLITEREARTLESPKKRTRPSAKPKVPKSLRDITLGLSSEKKHELELLLGVSL